MKSMARCVAVGAIFICEEMNERTPILVGRDNLLRQTGNSEKGNIAGASDFVKINENVLNKRGQKQTSNIGELIWKN